MAHTLTVMHPVAALEGAGIETEIAPRPTTLDGLRVGLIWNRKRGGDAILEQVGTMLTNRFSDVKLNIYQGSIPTPSDMLDQAAEECDVVVGSSSD
ncbi:MAG: hypothetical protein HOC77_03715 [Chloroflexi bacterium]|jgi:hypothetical protein|nr:hypothetical protein [Chloroflexota bacterium]MBT4074532.1 hypothetical protein [Chloroflexota bacterium]MBT4514186.1 hypothetical protein [Chloroflexota bacterium]MBT5319005.1 hypothetical protein [Chloroflexota bacterium]MBT6681594.1 hypothetical protein [Chloroflexota bacterium]